MGFECTPALCVENQLPFAIPSALEELTWLQIWVLECCSCFLKNCRSCFFPSCLWNMDVHGCDSQPYLYRSWEGWSNVISSGWTVLVCCTLLVLPSCICKRIKTSHQKSSSLFFCHLFINNLLSHSSVLLLLTLLVLSSLLVQDFLQNLILLPLLISLILCAGFYPGGFLQSSCAELQAHWRKISTRVRSHACEPTNTIPSFVAIPHFLLCYLGKLIASSLWEGDEVTSL